MRLRPHAWILVAALAPASAAQFAEFEWGLYGESTLGYAPQAVVDGEHVRIMGLSDDFCEGTRAWVQAVAPVDGHVSFSALFTNGGTNLHDEAPLAFLDGAFVTPAGPEFPSGVYPFDFDVAAGQLFGFGVLMQGCQIGPGVVEVCDLLFEPRTWFEVGGAIDPRTLRDVPAPAGAAGFGATLAGFGDLDGDGVGDLAVGAPAAGHAFVVSGADGSLLLDVACAADADLQVAGAGDFDGDGRPDLLLGLPQASGVGTAAGRIEVRSGADGSLLAARDGATTGGLLGASVAPAGDVDGDGYDDVLAGAPGDPFLGAFAGHAVIVGGPDGHLVRQFDESGSFGAAVAGIGDADGDGLPDVAIAMPGFSSVDVHSGITGALVSRASSFLVADGASLAPIGDHDGDGLADYVWGLPTVHQGVPYAADQAGRVWIRSGATGAVIAEWSGGNIWDVIGGAVATGDFDGDGIGDVACSTAVGDDSGYTVARPVRIVSGAPGGTVLHELGSGGAGGFGRALATPGDLDGDGIDDLAIGAPGASFGVRCVHALDGNGTPRLHGLGELVPEGGFLVELSQAGPVAPVHLVLGLDRLDLPFKGGVLVPRPDVVVPLLADAEGRVTLPARWPAGIPGPFFIWLQAWMVDSDAAHGLSASNGLGGLQP